MRLSVSSLFATMLLGALGGCGDNPPAAAPAAGAESAANLLFACDSGMRFSVMFDVGRTTATVRLPDATVVLTRASSPIGMRFTDGRRVLDINGDEASFVHASTSSRLDCRILK